MRNILSSVLQDLTYARRTFLRNPGFVAVTVISVGLGIAANTTIFSIVNATLFGALPVSEPARLVSFNEGDSLSYPDFGDYRDQTNVFEGVCAYFPLVPASLGGAEPERIWGQLVSGNYFSVLRLQPALGRSIRPDEDEVPGRDPVVVLSDGLWRRHFGADLRILGKQVILNNHTYTAIGVAPRGFHGEARGLLPEFWAPLAMRGQIAPELVADGDPVTKRNEQWLSLVARLQPGVSRQQAQAAVNVVKGHIDRTYRKEEKNPAPMRLTNAGAMPGLSNTPIFALLNILVVVVVIVLLIVCANVANLMLARGAARQREIGIRLAMGAGRGRLVRQLLTESILLALLGAVVGFLLALVAGRLLEKIQLPIPIPMGFDFSPDWRVLAFTGGLAVVTGIVFGLAPALRATRPDLLKTLKQEAPAAGRFRVLGTRNLLVVVQVAFSLVLLVSSGLFLRSLQSASSIDIGMHPKNVLSMAVDPKLHNYSVGRSRQFLEQLRRRITPLPGVRAVSFVDVVPLSIAGVMYAVTAAEEAQSKPLSVDVFHVGVDYFETMGIPLLRGRDFSPQSRDDLVILNETAASRLFPGGGALGREIRDHGKTYQVIAIARNSKSRTLGEGPRPGIFHMLERSPNQALSGYLGITLLVKTEGNPAALIQPVRRQIRDLDPNLAVFKIETIAEHLKSALLLPRLSAVLLGIFGSVALVLATAGLYGVMSYSVRRRTREIGIRLALGACTSRILRSVAAQGTLLAGVGLVIGLAMALALSRVTASLLYGISPTDLVTFAGVPVLLLAVAFVASVIPALRAARVDPSIALRCD